MNSNTRNDRRNNGTLFRDGQSGSRLLRSSFLTDLYFRVVLQSFADVNLTESGIDTVHFLEASDGLVTMFGTFKTSLHEFPPFKLFNVVYL